MFRKILYPTDFSDCAKEALDYVKKLREAGTEEVVILHVIHEYGFDHLTEVAKKINLDPESFKKDIIDSLFVKQEEKAQKLFEEIESEGLKATIRIEFGKPADKILEVSDEEDVSLIVMGSHGEGKVEEFFLGSVTEKVHRHAKVPVLAIR